MNHSIPRPPDDALDIFKPPSAGKVAAEAAFRAWSTPENIKRFNNQHVFFNAERLVASGATPDMARKNASDKGYGFSDVFIFYVHSGLLPEIDSDKPQGIVSWAKSQLKRFFPS